MTKYDFPNEINSNLSVNYIFYFVSFFISISDGSVAPTLYKNLYYKVFYSRLKFIVGKQNYYLK